MKSVAAQSHTGSIAVQKIRQDALGMGVNCTHFCLRSVTKHLEQHCCSMSSPKRMAQYLEPAALLQKGSLSMRASWPQ